MYYGGVLVTAFKRPDAAVGSAASEPDCCTDQSRRAARHKLKQVEMAPKFSSAEDEKLINVVHVHKAIYDAQNTDYKDQQIKDNIWDEIANHVGRNGEKKFNF